MRQGFCSKFSATVFLVFIIFNACTSSPPPHLQFPVVLNTEMVINECACGNAAALVDEQDLSKFPSPASWWNMDQCNKKLIEAPSAVIDLGAVYEITNFHFFDGQGEGNFEVLYGKPFAWTPLFTDPMTGYLQWKEKKIRIKTRYLQLRSVGRIFPGEIVLEGKLTEAVHSQKTTFNSIQYPLLKDFIGTNAFVDDPIGLLSPFGTIREYHPWPDWNQLIKGEIKHNPTEQGFNFDLYYSNLKRSGITASPVLQQSPEWITENKNKEAKPIHPGLDPLNPASYIDHADFMYQYAARYGSSEVSNLMLSANQERKTKLKLLTYFENWNEPDKWWKGREGYFTPYEYAAMSSADYDGHMGTMGPEKGIHNADLHAKLVMAGLANPNLDYIKALKFWSDHQRKGSFPWSVINVHHYSNDGKGQFQSQKGISPEDDHLVEKLEKFVKYRNQYLPGVEVWLTEFGYDVKDDSPQKATAIGATRPEEVQANWLIRSYLAATAAGIDKAIQYMIRDADGKGIYMSSGLYYWQKTGESKEAQRRASWYYISTMSKVLGNTRFDKKMKSADPDVNIYAFVSGENNQKIYALWCKTSENKKISDYAFTLPPGSKYAWTVSLEDKEPAGNINQLRITGNKVVVNISEKPLFIVVNNSSQYTLPPDDKLLKLTLAMVTNEGQGNVANLVDEQDMIGNPDMGIYPAKPKTNWDVPYNQPLPISAYIDLGKAYDVTKVYINDGPGNGELTISTGQPGNWEKISADGMYGYNTWKPHVINKKTRYIRISRATANTGVFEMAVYVK